ncbi:hypothetical protein V8C86DRAFT_604877 [Haematococcus lacustris]
MRTSPYGGEVAPPHRGTFQPPNRIPPAVLRHLPGHLCARTARVLGLITLLLLGCAAWAAALAASIATTLDATSPATAATAATTLDATSPTTAETSAGTSSEQPVTADGFQPAAAMAHLGHACFPSFWVMPVFRRRMKGGQHLKASTVSTRAAPTCQEACWSCWATGGGMGTVGTWGS